jgi:hypothetical protein
MESVFQYFFNEVLSGSVNADETRSRGLEAEFICAHDNTVECEYNSQAESITIAGKYICRGIPAKILMVCLSEHLKSGRTVFEFREFKRDASLVSHPKNTGFEVRLQRLRETLDRAEVGIRVEPIGRGKFALRLRGRVALCGAESAS